MRPDQQHGGVMAILQRAADAASLFRWRGREGEDSLALLVADNEEATALDAVAEYIAANDEYDESLLADYHLVPGAHLRVELAKERRALAHARMKGETK